MKMKRILLFDKILLQVYKQTILPIFDYGGLVLLYLKHDDRFEMQKIQNDLLRICNNVRVKDKVTLEIGHKEARLLGRE